MQLRGDRRAVSAAKWCVVRSMLVFAAAALLAACQTNGDPGFSLASARGPSIAFESIDGPPPELFGKLVDELNAEARSRRLVIVSRQSPSTYRVRGHLAASVEGGHTAIAWTWDVYDAERRRALRISGTQSRPGKRKVSEAWAAADDDMVKAIAATSLDELADFLASTGPAAPPAQAAVLAAPADPHSPEAAGIFRILRANADPEPVGEAAALTAVDRGAAIPLPPRRPDPRHERVAATDLADR